MVWAGCLAVLMGNFLSPWEVVALVGCGTQLRLLLQLLYHQKR